MSQRKTIACGIASLAFCAVALAGCASSLSFDAPDNHFTDSTRTTFEFNHQRCGGCHEGANRGNLSFEYIAQPGIIQEFNNDQDTTGALPSPDQIIQEFNSEYMDQANNLGE